MIIQRDFFERDTLSVAEELIGCSIMSNASGIITGGIIVETEAYLGKVDPAAHSYKGKSNRVRVLYEQKGLAYIYLIYGMYWCLNFSSGPAGEPECVLLRAIEPTVGLNTMTARRGTAKKVNLCSGPGKLCEALEITGELYGCDLCDGDSPLYIEYGTDNIKVDRAKRIGIEYAGEARNNLWRFAAHGSEFLSKKL